MFILSSWYNLNILSMLLLRQVTNYFQYICWMVYRQKYLVNLILLSWFWNNCFTDHYLSFLSLLLLSSYCNGDSNNTYYVNSSSDSEQYLCNTTWSSQYLVFLLNSSVNFTISSGNFCQVSYETGRIKICSKSYTESAIITCTNNDIQDAIQQPRRGLIFFNTTVILQQYLISWFSQVTIII